MAKMRAVIVGFGVMGRLHFETLLGREGVEIVGIVRASACPPHMGVPVFTTLPEALTGAASI